MVFGGAKEQRAGGGGRALRRERHNKPPILCEGIWQRRNGRASQFSYEDNLLRSGGIFVRSVINEFPLENRAFEMTIMMRFKPGSIELRTAILVPRTRIERS